MRIREYGDRTGSPLAFSGLGLVYNQTFAGTGDFVRDKATVRRRCFLPLTCPRGGTLRTITEDYFDH